MDQLVGMRLARATEILAGTAALAVFVFIAIRSPARVEGLALAVWAALPLSGVVIASRRWSASRRPQFILLLSAVLLSGWSAWSIFLNLYLHRESLSELSVAVTPVYQLIVLALAISFSAYVQPPRVVA